MLNKLSFNKRLTLYLVLVFVVFSVLIVLLQYKRESDFRTRQLENTLDNITEMTNKYIVNKRINQTGAYFQIDSLKSILPETNIRISVIDASGIVNYDSEVGALDEMENHLKRPELQLALRNEFGSNIRMSATTGFSYYYYSKYYGAYYIRTAALYDVKIQDFLKAEKVFIFYLITISLLSVLVLILIMNRISQTLVRLKDFAIAISRGNKVEAVHFPEGELGVVSSEIVKIYNQLTEAKDSLSIEKNKLFGHLDALNEGVAFFSGKKEKIFSNNHFIHFLNHISKKTTISASDVFNVADFIEINQFIDHQLEKEDEINIHNLPQHHIEIFKNNKYFEISCIFFEDENFEIVIKDISKLEKRKIMKQQMTSNISHELKTPAATIQAYLETVLNNDLKDKKKSYFIEKAYAQTKKLTALLEDLSTLNNIEETNSNFVFDQLDIVEILDEVKESLQLKLETHQVKIKLHLPEKLSMNGNRTLLYSVFYNLFDNAIKYGGEGFSIIVDNYMDENGYLHFSVANTGNEIEEQHLPRIFERFYRVDSGRSRKTGGTGLGLAIVKNAIQLHGGSISARKYNKGGLEFLFSLAKN